MRRCVVSVVAVLGLLAVVTPVQARVDGGVGTAAVGTFVAVTPTRILDTRTGTGGLSGPFAPNQVQNLTVTGGIVPTTADAVAMNVTATQPSSPGYLTVSPAGQTLPLASNLNFVASQTVPNLVVVKVGHGGANEGKVSIGNTAVASGPQPLAGTVHVIADVVGYYTDASGAAAGFTGMTPTRILDTRFGVGLLGPFGANQTRNVLVADAGAPADADAVVLNVTATQPTAAGFLTLYPAGDPLPLASNLNFVPNLTVANLVTVKVGTNGEVAILNSAGTTHVVADLVGYYKTGTGANLTAITPTRVLDTRTGAGTPIASNATFSVDPHVAGGSVPAVGNYSALIANVTATAPTQPGFVTVFPSDVTAPLASNLNFLANDTVPNLAEVRVGSDGKFKITNGSTGTVHVIVDVVGYFTGNAGAPPPPPAPLAPPPPTVSAPTPAPTLNQSALVNTPTGLNRPWDLAFLPGASGPDNGRLLYTENDAKTVSAYISNAEPRRVLLTNNDIDTTGEGGTMGIAVHPDYPTNKSVYVCLTSLSGGDNRVVKYTLNVDGSGIPTPASTPVGGLTNPVPIVTGMLKNSFHNGCRVRFQPGATPPALFITMGDAGSGPSPQDPNGMNGKVLRVDENGNAYPGNPFGRRWFTRGHRNPQGIAFRPGTNQPYNSEHGPNINDEVNALTVGGNAGWEPNTSGNYDQTHTMTDLNKANVIRPQWRSGDSVTIAPSGMTFVQNVGGKDWKAWQGNIVLAVLKNAELRMLVVDGSGNVTGQVQIAQPGPRLRVPVLGPDGKLYVTTDENPGQILVFDPA